MGSHDKNDRNDRKYIKIDKERELRTNEISKMISEGGLGADRYYDIEKHYTRLKEDQRTKEDKYNDY